MPVAIILARYWQALLGTLIAVALSITLAVRTHERDTARAGWAAEKTAFATTVQNYRLATARAQADDLAHARAVETRDAAIAKESNDALQDQLASARAAADQYARRLRAAASSTDSGGRGAAGLPAATDAARAVAGAGQATVVDDDARVCAENTVLAAGWQSWWRSVSEESR